MWRFICKTHKTPAIMPSSLQTCWFHITKKGSHIENAPLLMKKVQWAKCDTDSYKEHILLNIKNISSPFDIGTANAATITLNSLLQDAAKKSTPAIKERRLKSSKIWSPAIKIAFHKSKQALRRWQDAGRPLRPHPLFIRKTESRKAHRVKQRKESAKRR